MELHSHSHLRNRPSLPLEDYLTLHQVVYHLWQANHSHHLELKEVSRGVLLVNTVQAHLQPIHHQLAVLEDRTVSPRPQTYPSDLLSMLHQSITSNCNKCIMGKFLVSLALMLCQLTEL